MLQLKEPIAIVVVEVMVCVMFDVLSFPFHLYVSILILGSIHKAAHLILRRLSVTSGKDATTWALTLKPAKHPTFV